MTGSNPYRDGRENDDRKCDRSTGNTKSSGGRCTNGTMVVKKYSISEELAQRMVDAAVEKARGTGVSENVRFSDDGGKSQGLWPVDGAPSLTTEMAQNKGITQALSGVSTQGFFNLLSERPSRLAGITPLRVWRSGVEGFPLRERRSSSGPIGAQRCPSYSAETTSDGARAALALSIRCGYCGLKMR